MSTVTQGHPLLLATRPPSGPQPPEPLFEELRELAGRHDHCSARSRHLHEQLRKMLGQDRLTACLLGIQALAMNSEPAGARLLAALLDANTPGSVLLPRVRLFRSTGRLLSTDTELIGNSFLSAWQGRLADVVVACSQRFGLGLDQAPKRSTPVLDRHPLPALRKALVELTSGMAIMPCMKTNRLLDTKIARTPISLPSEPMTIQDQRLLAGLIRLECEAYQERVSRLAGSIDPYRSAAVMRVLPLLSRADAEIRDLDLLASWLENGEFSQAFEHRIPTGWDVLEESERSRFKAALQGEARLAPLMAVHAVFLAAPLSVRQLAGPAARLLVLGQALVDAGLREEPLHLLDAVHLALAYTRHDRFELPLNEDLKEAITCSLLAAKMGSWNDMAGLQILGDLLVLQQPHLTLSDRFWKHDLPTVQELQTDVPIMSGPEATSTSEEQAIAAGKQQKLQAKDTSAQAVKQLVMNNVGCVSIVLGFLRNPKVTSIPGLVADVVRRTRSSRVLEAIANDRSLTSGHANKDVPRALLESPVNLSVKSLRQFIHVKFVSKTDLRRLAKDKARLRKEVCQEIEKYLASLV